MIFESAEIHIYGARLVNIIIATEPYTVQTVPAEASGGGRRVNGGGRMVTGGAIAQPAPACRRQTRHDMH